MRETAAAGQGDGGLAVAGIDKDVALGIRRHARGHAGKLAPGFQVVHMMDCRNPNQIIVGEIESWRMQKFVLKGSK